jgi:hypothetical protein
MNIVGIKPLLMAIREERVLSCAPCDRSGRSALPEVARGLTPDRYSKICSDRPVDVDRPWLRAVWASFLSFGLFGVRDVDHLEPRLDEHFNAQRAERIPFLHHQNRSRLVTGLRQEEKTATTGRVPGRRSSLLGTDDGRGG